MSENFAASRRAIMFGGAAVAAVLPSVSAANVLAAPFQQHDVADWQKHVGKDFAIAGEAGAAPMRLVEVSDPIRQGMRSGSARMHNFSVRFEMDAASAPQGGQLYPVKHPQFGTAQLYLERATAPKGKAAFRAYFN